MHFEFVNKLHYAGAINSEEVVINFADCKVSDCKSPFGCDCQWS